MARAALLALVATVLATPPARGVNPREDTAELDREGVRVVRVGPSRAAGATTIAAGVALVPDNATVRWTVEVEPGVYRERVTTAGKGPLSIVGLTATAGAIVLAFGCSANKGTGTAGCRPCLPAAGFASRATLTVASEDFVAANMTLANDACGFNAGLAAQSEAVSVGADRAAFSRCHFLGGQVRDPLAACRGRGVPAHHGLAQPKYSSHGLFLRADAGTHAPENTRVSKLVLPAH